MVEHTPLTTQDLEFRQILDSMGIGYWECDHVHDRLTFGPCLRAAVGGDFPDQSGSPLAAWMERIHPEDRPRVAAAVAATIETDEPFDIEYRFAHATGRWIWLLSRGRVVKRDQQGTPLLSSGVKADITRRKEEEEYARLQQAFDHALSESPDRETLVAAILETALILSEVDACGYYQRQPDGGYALLVSTGLSPDFAARIERIPAETTLIERIESGQTLVSCTCDCPACLGPSLNGQPDLADEALTSVMSVPIQVSGRYEAYLYLASKHVTCLLTEKIPLLEGFAHQIGRALELLGIREEASAQRQKLQLAASVFSHSREAIVITSVDGTIIDVNEAFSHITGYRRGEVLGKNPRILKSNRQSREFYIELWSSLIEKGHWYGEIWNRRKNGEVYPEMLTISAVRDGKGCVRHYVALFSDISTIKEHQRQLEHIAHYDALTTLPNRVLLADRLHQAMAQAQRRAQQLAVAYLDLDGFKAVNDRHGHETGDQLLMAISARMKQALREGDTLARLGGDEFVAVLIDLADIGASLPMLTRLLAAAAEPVHVGELVLQVSASIGVTFYPQADEVDADQLLRQADQAMYQAKLAGKNRFHIFDAEQDRSVRGHHESLEHIRRALEQREFVLYYQPKVNMRSGAVVGVEALIRWQHPEHGLLPPATFLPVIEDHPLAVEVGEWVIDTALTQMESWRAAGLDLPVSVNIGARQLQQDDFVARLRHLLAKHPGREPSGLELEVLETSALEDLAQVSQVIEACRTIGIGFALDDFGTGYSSLAYLKRLAVNVLKIDQSFVRDMLDDPDDLAILEGVLGLATAFRRQVIAEGVETLEHGEMLLQLGCELAQGYGIARPMPAADIPVWAATWRPDAAWANCSAVSRDDLPVLFAGVEHRAWITAMVRHLRGEGVAPPPLAHHQCRFGRWLDGEGRARHGARPAFQAIESLHRQVHDLANALRDSSGRGAAAQDRLPELYRLRDELLAALRGVVGSYY